MALINSFDSAFVNRKVLVTGHTGFKGSWLSLWLSELGAKVVGCSLAPNTVPSLYEQLGLKNIMDSYIGDVRDGFFLKRLLQETQPEIVFHLAAQPIVRLSYRQPVETFSTNIQGVVNILDAIRETNSVKVCLVVTTDKCYENRETAHAHKEVDVLGGRDPYSASKACAELVVSSYRDSFFNRGPSVSSARAGNVIGGGDWSEDRLFPDCMRALAAAKPIMIRNPESIRPWQFVLDPLMGYLKLASFQLSEPEDFSEAWNFGPTHDDSVTAGEIANLILKIWGTGEWVHSASDLVSPYEASLLRLDSTKSKKRLGWRSVYNTEQAVAHTVDWYRFARQKESDVLSFSRKQIAEYTRAAL